MRIIETDIPDVLIIDDLKGLRDFTLDVAPDLIVNAAAYTAVDKAEIEPEIALTINGEAPGVLAEVAKMLNARLLHYSTDYVFDGLKREPYTEDDKPNPINVYGRTKLAGDVAIQQSGCEYLILRTSWVYGMRGRNFFLTILRLGREREVLKVVDDQIGSPTWSRSIANATKHICLKVIPVDMRYLSGIYNFSSCGEISWFDFAKAIIETDPNKSEIQTHEISPISSREFPTTARRPAYSVLSKDKIMKEFSVEVTSWIEQLISCWNQMGEKQVKLVHEN